MFIHGWPGKMIFASLMYIMLGLIEFSRELSRIHRHLGVFAEQVQP